eukprot:1194463-Prorocentrum_minimum.AAC.1
MTAEAPIYYGYFPGGNDGETLSVSIMVSPVRATSHVWFIMIRVTRLCYSCFIASLPPQSQNIAACQLERLR